MCALGNVLSAGAGGGKRHWCIFPGFKTLGGQRAKICIILRPVLNRHLIPQILIGDEDNDGDK